MTAALLEAHGLRTGAVVSPHTDRWSQRTLIGGEEVDPVAWAEAVEQVSHAAEGVDRSLDDGDAVTQFEAATAASFVALARARVEVAVVEAGLGGRLDATNTIPPRSPSSPRSASTTPSGWGRPRSRSRRRSWRSCATRRRWCWARSRQRWRRWPRGPRASAAPGSYALRGSPPPRCACAPRESSSGAISRSPVVWRKRSWSVRWRPTGSRRWPQRSRSPDASSRLPSTRRPTSMPPTTPLAPPLWPSRCRRWARGGAVVACLAILADKDAAAMVAALAPALDRVVCTELPFAALEGTAVPAPARVRRRSWRRLRGGGSPGRDRARFRRRPGTGPGPCRRAARRRSPGRRFPLCNRPGSGADRGLTMRGFEHGSSSQRRFRTGLDDGAGRRRGCDRDPRLLRRRIPVWKAFPLREPPQGWRRRRRSRLPLPQPRRVPSLCP